MIVLGSLLLLLFLAEPTAADNQYKTRPDLSPPRLNITVPASDDVAPGYIFVCPYSGFKKGNGFDGPEQPAGYIFQDDGELIWSSMGYLSGWVGNMQVSSWKGKPVISAFQGTLDSFHGHGFGHPTILDENYENIRDLRGGNHKIVSIHEFNILDSGSALVEIYQPVQRDLSQYDGEPGATWIVDAIFQEIDLETGKLLFEWSSLAHVPPSHSAVSLHSGYAGNGQNSTAAWDYFHINSVDKDLDGNYLISARHASALYKINGQTGEIMWQLGGHKSSFSYSDNLLFGFQHDARFVKKSVNRNGIEFVSLFDNAARANGHRGGGVQVIHSRSRAKVIRLDTVNWTASLEWSLTSPDDLLAPSQGNVQTLPNGNLFVNWGQAGAITEYRGDDGEVIFHAYLDSGEIGEGVQSYRGFRFPWNGYPNETPAIVALDSDKGTVVIYVSWNGDTETAQWLFYVTQASCTFGSKYLSRCRPHLLGETTRTGFETSFEAKDAIFLMKDRSTFTVYAEAINGRGHAIATTEAIKIQQMPRISDGNRINLRPEGQVQLELK